MVNDGGVCGGPEGPWDSMPELCNSRESLQRTNPLTRTLSRTHTHTHACTARRGQIRAKADGPLPPPPPPLPPIGCEPGRRVRSLPDRRVSAGDYHQRPRESREGHAGSHTGDRGEVGRRGGVSGRCGGGGRGSGGGPRPGERRVSRAPRSHAHAWLPSGSRRGLTVQSCRHHPSPCGAGGMRGVHTGGGIMAAMDKRDSRSIPGIPGLWCILTSPSVAHGPSVARRVAFQRGRRPQCPRATGRNTGQWERTDGGRGSGPRVEVATWGVNTDETMAGI